MTSIKISIDKDGNLVTHKVETTKDVATRFIAQGVVLIGGVLLLRGTSGPRRVVGIFNVAARLLGIGLGIGVLAKTYQDHAAADNDEG